MESYLTIDAAWFHSCRDAINFGREYTIQRGSYKNQKRRQLDSLAFKISKPWTRPLGITFKGEQISNDNDIVNYFSQYLINPDVQVNEKYTYASRISPHLPAIAAILSETPHTNQATIEVARPEDIYIDDPPCLRIISWKLTNEGLQLTAFFRSWDLYTGLPTNLGGLQLLNEMMAEWCEQKAGPLVCYSDGGHLYDYAWSLFD